MWLLARVWILLLQAGRLMSWKTLTGARLSVILESWDNVKVNLRLAGLRMIGLLRLEIRRRLAVLCIM